MEISTKYFGEINIDEGVIVHFYNGIPGFEEETSFVFLPLTADSPFTVMQSTKTPQLAFITTSPFLFFKDYDITISDQTVEQLQFESEQDTTVYTILTIKEPFEESTVNLVAPVLVNYKKQLGKQLVLEKTPYSIRHPLFSKKAVGEGVEQHAGAHTQEK